MKVLHSFSDIRYALSIKTQAFQSDTSSLDKSCTLFRNSPECPIKKPYASFVSWSLIVKCNGAVELSSHEMFQRSRVSLLVRSNITVPGETVTEIECFLVIKSADASLKRNVKRTHLPLLMRSSQCLRARKTGRHILQLEYRGDK